MASPFYLMQYPGSQPTITIKAWHKQVGEVVNDGDVLVTYKEGHQEMDLEAPEGGVLLYQIGGGEVGVEVPLDNVMFVIGKPGEPFEHLIADEPPIQENARDFTLPNDEVVYPNDPPGVVRVTHEGMLRGPYTLVEWHVRLGDEVQEGELLLELENEVASFDLSASQPGKVIYVGGEAGDLLRSGEVLVVIADPREDVEAVLEQLKTSTPIVQERRPWLSVVKMPQVYDTQEVGSIVEWFKAPGDDVKKGEVVVEVDTELTIVRLEADSTGVLLYQGAPTGGEIPVRGVVAMVGPPDTDVKAVLARYPL